MVAHPQSILLITGSSGVGKDTVLLELIKQYPGLQRVISVTTRWPARDDENFGEHYYFVDQERFAWLQSTNQLLEFSQEYGHEYGLLKTELTRAQAAGRRPIQALDFHGIDMLIEAGMQTQAVFLDFPNQASQQHRLLHRQPDMSHIELDERMSHAAEERAEAVRRAADGQLTIIINDHIGACVQDVARAFQLNPR